MLFKIKGTSAWIKMQPGFLLTKYVSIIDI